MSEDATLDKFVSETDDDLEDVKRVYLGPKEVSISAEWEITNIGNVCDTVYRYPTYYDIEYVENGIPEIRPEVIKEDGELANDTEIYRHISEETAEEYPRTELDSYDFVLSVRGTIGQVGMVRPEFEGANITANLIRLSPKYQETNPEFLKQIFLSHPFQQLLETYSTRTTIKTITSDALQSIPFRLPQLNEQRKIATVLYTVDQAIEKTKSAIDHYENLQTGLLRRHFGKDSVQANYSDDRETKRLGPKSYTVPKDWENVQIADIGDVVTGDTPSTKNEDYYGGDLPFITPEDFGETKRVYRGSRELTDEGRQKSRPIPEDAVMMDCIGMDMGKVRIAGRELATNQQINSVIVNTDKMLPEFLYFHLKAISNLIQSQAGQTRTPIVSKSQFSSFEVFCPPLPAQEDVVNSLSVFDDLIEKESEYATQLRRLKRGLMQDLLSGTVRTTDANIDVPDEIAQHG